MFTRRLFLQVLASGAAGCVTPRFGKRDTVVEGTFDTIEDFVEPVDVSQFRYDLLKRTPITPKSVTVYYEVGSDAEVEFLERALPYARASLQDYDITASFEPVTDLHEIPLDKRTTFGLRFRVRKDFFRAKILDNDEIDVGQFDDYVTWCRKESSLVWEATCEDIEEHNQALKLYEGFYLLSPTTGFTNCETGIIYVLSDGDFLPKRVDAYRGQGEKLRSEGYDFMQGSFPPEIAERLLATRVLHELGHHWGLPHTFDCEDNGIPNVQEDPHIANIMSYEGPTIHTNEDNKTAYTGYAINPLGEIFVPLQVSIIHNYLSGGPVQLSTRDRESYIQSLRSANGQTDCEQRKD